MHRTVLTASEDETKLQGAILATDVHEKKTKSFISLSGPLGAGKSAFIRGFIYKWCSLNGEASPEIIVSPSYNIAKTYGETKKVAHLDLYRLKSIEELENLGFEHYFNDFDVCLVEWLDQIPEAVNFVPQNAISVSIDFGKDSNQRKISLKF